MIEKRETERRAFAEEERRGKEHSFEEEKSRFIFDGETLSELAIVFVRSL